MPQPPSVAVVAQGSDWRLPGVANLHSHAFQRAMAGLAERQTHPNDSFWTWRETMYRFAARFDPDTLLPLLQAVGSNNFLVEGVNKWIRVKNPYDREGSVVK